MISYTVGQIAEALGAKAFGALDISITCAAEPQDAGATALALAMSPKYAEHLAHGHARAAMLWEGADFAALGLEAAIIAPRPRFAMSGLSAMLDAGQGFDAGHHASAVIDPSAEIGEDVRIGPLCVISKGARIGAGSVLGPQCHIGWDAEIGEGAYLREGVSIGARVRIGARFIAQPGARIGGDGFSFVTPEPSHIEAVRDSLGADQTATESAGQSYARIHSLGTVEIGDDVEIGANACIDNGTVRATRIGNGVKIDNLAQIGHNVVVGDDCLICAQVGIAGSTRLGRAVVLGGQTGVSDNLFIGDGAVTGGATKVLANVPAGRVMLGYPAMKMDNHIETYKALRRLPRMMREFATIKKLVSKSGVND